MDSPPPERIQRLVSSLVSDETQAANLMELLDYVSDPEGNAIRYSAALKAMSQAYKGTSDFERHRDQFRAELGATVSAGTIG